MASWWTSLTRSFSRYVQGDGDRSALVRMADPERNNDLGVVCLHGFTGTPFEVRPLAEMLHAAGFSVAVPLLTGHGGAPEVLAETRWPDWLAAAEAAMDDLHQRMLAFTPTPRIGIAGFSMGGLLALRMARLRPGAIDAIAVMSAPLRLREREVRAIRALARIPNRLRRGPLELVPKRDGPDTSDPEMRKLNPGMPVLPIRALASMVDLGAVVRRDLPFIATPTLVAHGRHDHTVPFDDALEIAGSLVAEVVERLWLEKSYHLVGIDVERRELGAALVRFFTRYLGAREATGGGPAAAAARKTGLP